MRLLRIEQGGNFSLTEFSGSDVPRYAIISHTWGRDDEEVIFRDLEQGTGHDKAGYRKIRFCGEQATKDGLEYFWVDTCCIDKSSSAELAEAINSMFRWYQEAAKCYVYLSDVSTDGADWNIEAIWFTHCPASRWFRRGWTLQELLAPKAVEFFSGEWAYIGNKQEIAQNIHQITGISIQALHGTPLSEFSISERLSWAKYRDTKREEDAAYCLLGVFDVHLPPIYGERRKNAFQRLLCEIRTRSNDELPAPSYFSFPTSVALKEESSVTKAWVDLMKQRGMSHRCLNCGGLDHREYQCAEKCGRCTKSFLTI